MAAVAENLSLMEFQARYETGDQAYEYWHGRAMPKGMPTWLHGTLQRIIMELLTEAGYFAGSEVELRIAPNAHPKPDVIGTRDELEEPYPTEAVDVVVEILSPNDSMAYMIEKCQAYQAWGFPNIYVVDPEKRLLFCWREQGLEISSSLAETPSSKIWEKLDLVPRRTRLK